MRVLGALDDPPGIAHAPEVALGAIPDSSGREILDALMSGSAVAARAYSPCAMSTGKLESFLQRGPRWAWLGVAAVSLVALLIMTRNFFVPVCLGVLLIGVRVLPKERVGTAPGIALFVTLALMLVWKLLS